jgi:hypothetical protein
MSDQLSQLLAEVDDLAADPGARALNAALVLSEQALAGTGKEALDRADHLRRIATCCEDVTAHLLKQADRAH